MRRFALSILCLAISAGLAVGSVFATASFPAAATFPGSVAINTTVDSVIISGAGEASTTGTWIDSGEFNGHRYYVKLGKDDSSGTFWTLKYNSVTGWTLTADQNVDGESGVGSDDLYKSSTSGDGLPDADYPWLVSQWYVIAPVVALPVPTFAHGKAPGFPQTIPDEQPLPRYEGITSAQKLSLDPASPVGTQVSVSDGFVLDYADTSGFFAADGTTLAGKPLYKSQSFFDVPTTVGFSTGGGDYPDGRWLGWPTSDGEGSYNTIVSDPDFPDVANYPWEIVHFNPSGSSITHPALQALAAPSSAQGGVFVSDTEANDGVCPIVDTLNDKGHYQILGGLGTLDVSWNENFTNAGNPSPISVWYISTANGDNYYSLSDVATPDLATNWKNASDDSPAAITVTSVSQGDLVAGLQLDGVTYTVNGAQNGRNKYTDVLGVADDIFWDLEDPTPVIGHDARWTDGTTNGTTNSAFPDFGTPDPVAAEANWEVVTP